MIIGKGVKGEESAKEKAKQVEAAKRTELALSNAGIKKRPPAPLFSDFVKQFEGWLAAERADKPNTVQFYNDRIRQLLKFDRLKNAPLDLIDEQLVAEYIQWRTKQTRQYTLRKKQGIELAETFEPVTVACVNRDLKALKRVLNIARLWKVILSFRLSSYFPASRITNVF